MKTPVFVVIAGDILDFSTPLKRAVIKM